MLSMLVLGTHFYRAGHLLLAGGALLSLGLLFIRRPVMVTGWCKGCSWQARWNGLPPQSGARHLPAGPRASLAASCGLLGLVALCTLLSTLVFTTSRLKARYNLPQKTQAKK